MMNPMQVFQEYQKFRETFEGNNPGVSPQQIIQNMLNEGEVSQQMVEQARAMAQMVGLKM